MQNHAIIQAGKRFLVVILDTSSHSQTRANLKVQSFINLPIPSQILIISEDGETTASLGNLL